MQIIGFILTKIAGSRDESKSHPIRLSQDLKITHLYKDVLSISNQEVVNLTFHYAINYEEDFGKVEFEGKITILTKDDEAETMLKAWKQKELPASFKVPVYNLIMQKCNVKAIELEDDLNLPFHIPMPQVDLKQNSKD